MVEIGLGERESMCRETYKLCTGGMKADQPQLSVLVAVEGIYSIS
jgi:hypothetical protein